MLPLPACEVLFPTSVAETLEHLRARPGARLVAGGTDLLPNLKRGVGRPTTLVSLAKVQGLDALVRGDSELRIGARITLARLARDPSVPRAIAHAAASIASPQIRNVATVGGNLCLDTRCVYVNQTAFWRGALGHCIKADGSECHVVPGGKRCVAAASADLPPVLVALGASVRVLSVEGERLIPIDKLYANDGAAPIALPADALIAEVVVPIDERVRAAYRKLRARGAIDFPLLGVAVAVAIEQGVVEQGAVEQGVCRSIRVVASGIGSAPRRVSKLDDLAVGRPLDAATIDAVARRCFEALHPQANIAADSEWRRAMIPVLVRDAFAEMAVHSR
ncbi:MAG: FAD binding domain-containing protein [Deltaproteobacteria bacterium]|nr:FAD binding domain-containing protein [Deltaproteobacteria bacterium]